MRLRAALAVGLVLVAAQSGCASETEQYCSSLEERKDDVTGLVGQTGDPGRDVLAEGSELFGELRDAAPGDIVDEWDTFLFAWEGIAEAADRAGVSPGEYDPANPPEGVSQADVEALEDAAEELRSPRVLDAVSGIQQHATDVCKVDLAS